MIGGGSSHMSEMRVHPIFSTIHLASATFLLGHAKQIELDTTIADESEEHVAYVTGAIVFAYAPIEAAIAEPFVKASEEYKGLDCQYWVSAELVLRMKSIWDFKGNAHLDFGRSAARNLFKPDPELGKKGWWQSATKLGNLRNYFMHYTGGFQ